MKGPRSIGDFLLRCFLNFSAASSGEIRSSIMSFKPSSTPPNIFTLGLSQGASDSIMKSYRSLKDPELSESNNCTINSLFQEIKL